MGTYNPFDRDQRRDRDYATHGNSPNPLRCPGGNRFTNPVSRLAWSLSWSDWDRDANTTTQSCWHSSNPHRSYRARTETENWNQWTALVSRRSLPINASSLSLVLSCTTGASKIVLFLFTTGVSMNNFQTHQGTLSKQNRDSTKLVRSFERWSRLKVPNRALRNQSHLLVYVRGRAQTDCGL